MVNLVRASILVTLYAPLSLLIRTFHLFSPFKRQTFRGSIPIAQIPIDILFKVIWLGRGHKVCPARQVTQSLLDNVLVFLIGITLAFAQL